MIRELEKLAVDAALASGKVLMKYFKGSLQVKHKPGAGLVTNADIQSEQTALKILKKIGPEFSILAEESGVTSGRQNTTRKKISKKSVRKKSSDHTKTSEEGRWIIDPLDGTTNFVHGFPMFCVSIGAEWNHELVLGVIYHPVLDELYIAKKGKGATLNGKKIHVSQTKELGDSLLATGFTYRKDDWLKREMDAFERLSLVARAIRRPGSAALDLAYTARGVFDGFWERRLSPWDVSAGALLVAEAGGTVTDFNRQNFSVDKKEILASNGILHDRLLQTIEPEICLI